MPSKNMVPAQQLSAAKDAEIANLRAVLKDVLKKADEEIAALTEQRDAALEKADIIGNVCGEAYQVMGALSYLTGTTSHPDVVRALDNLAYHDDPPHGDLLPWPKTLEGLEIEKEIAALTEQRDELQQSASEWTEICEMMQQALAAATGKSAGGFMPMCFNDAIRKIATERDTVTEQRDRAMAVVEAARKAVLQIRVHGETCHELTDALAALDTLSSPSLPESPEASIEGE